MKYTLVILILTTLNSCSKKERTLEYFETNKIKFAKQKISPTTDEFTLFIPKDWSWKNEDYGHKNVLLAIDAVSPEDKEGYIDVITIQKMKSLGNSEDLKAEYLYCLERCKNQSTGMKLIESGKTDALIYPAYFIHQKSNTGTKGETEMISFILESDIEGVFYILNAGVSQTENLDKNMSILIQSLKTFKLKS